MRTAPQFLGFVIFLGILFTSCSRQDFNSQNTNQSSNTNQAIENSSSTKDNTEGLEMIVKLPFEPQDAVWREEKSGKPNEGKLIAVLQFKSEDAEKIVAQSQTYKNPTPADISAESWFPAELIAQSQLSGDETLKGTTYAANDFLQSPYTDGKITRIQSSNYFILELISK